MLFIALSCFAVLASASPASSGGRAFVPVIESFEGRYVSVECAFASRAELFRGEAEIRYLRAYRADGTLALSREFRQLNGAAWSRLAERSDEAPSAILETRSRFICGPVSCKLWNEKQSCGGAGLESRCRAWASFQDEEARFDGSSLTLTGEGGEECVFNRAD